MEEKKYAVVEEVEYYDGDCQHPKGWNISVATYADKEDYTEYPCIGTREECEKWLADIYDGRIYINNGEASKIYYIAEITEEDACHQTWLDTIDWEGCPSEDGSDYNANVQWAETMIRDIKGNLHINHPENYYGLIVSLEER